MSSSRAPPITVHHPKGLPGLEPGAAPDAERHRVLSRAQNRQRPAAGVLSDWPEPEEDAQDADDDIDHDAVLINETRVGTPKRTKVNRSRPASNNSATSSKLNPSRCAASITRSTVTVSAG